MLSIPSLWSSKLASSKLLPLPSYNVRVVEDNVSNNFLLPQMLPKKSYYRGYLKSRMDFLIQCVGLSVGLGNIWRFPHLAYENHGVSFLVPYAILLFLVGNPIFFVEIGIGQYSGQGPSIIGKMVPLAKGVSAAMAYLSMLTLVYYGALMAQCLTYIVVSFHSELPWTQCSSIWDSSFRCTNRTKTNMSDSLGRELLTPAEDFYHAYVLNLDPNLLYKGIGTINHRLLVYLGLGWLIVFVGLVKGRNGIGKNWRRAAEQVFYSLDISTGNLIMYGASCEFRSSSLKDVLIVTTLDLCVSVAAGSIVFMVIGVLSKETNIGFYYVTNTGTGLVFICFSEVAYRMPWPRVCNFFIFSCLFFVCLESQFCYMDPVLCTLLDIFPSLKRRETSTIGAICFLMFLLGLPCISQGGLYVITLMDDIGAAMGLVFVGLTEIICISGVYGVNNFLEDMHFMLGKRPSLMWRSLLVVGPVILSIIIFQFTVSWTSPEYLHIRFPTYALVTGWLSCITSVLIIVLIGLHEVIKAHQKGDISSVIHATPEWAPDSKTLTRARSIFQMFNSADKVRPRRKSRRVSKQVDMSPLEEEYDLSKLEEISSESSSQTEDSHFTTVSFRPSRLPSSDLPDK